MSNDIKSHVSACGQYHVNEQGDKLYNNAFDRVLPFHKTDNEKQLAPVKYNKQAWHILTNGSPAYEERYDEVFGFYGGLAAVIKQGKWFHIHSNGQPAYSKTYTFVGNFQQHISVVCNEHNQYLHVDKLGRPLYQSRWRYCGDFREGSAVVQSDHGLSTHILTNGEFLHHQWFLDLDVYHKGYARAQDKKGWHHIDKQGREIYSARYTNVEPFYNGCARVEDCFGALLIIDELGNILRTIRAASHNLFSELSADMVGYWKTFAIATAVELNIFDYLPSTSKSLSNSTFSNEERLTRLLKGLGELGIVNLVNHVWCLSPKGEYLQGSHELSLANAALEYKNDLLKRWYALPDIIKGENVKQDIFYEIDSSEVRRNKHHEMLRSYAIHDYKNIINFLPIKDSDTVFDAGGGNGALCELIKEKFPNSHIVLGDMPNVMGRLQKSELTSLAFDLFKHWTIKADKIILARVLHDWNDEQAVAILNNAKDSLKEGGEIIILEMLLENLGFSGSLCDLHLLASTGGQERTLEQFDNILAKTKLSLTSAINTGSLITILRVSK